MSPNINIRWLIGSIMIFMLPVIINAQEQDREQVGNDAIFSGYSS